jgi:hypothetical protein
MKQNRVQWLRYTLNAAVILLIGYLIFGVSAARRSSATASVAVGDQVMRLRGPYTHDNMSVYLLCAPAQDKRSFITLKEGLDSGQVVVTEKQNASVNELVIENKSDDYLFLQEGDLLKGGQQDRTIFASSIVVPHSGQQSVKAFCVEPSRWTAGAQGAAFSNAGNPVLAPKEVRQAAKYEGSQTGVWDQVALQRTGLQTAGVAAANFATTSFNEAGDSEKVKGIAAGYNRALGYVLDLHDDAAGVAIAINGQIEEVNIYPNKQVLQKQFPRLIGSYAVKAVVQQKAGENAKPMQPSAVAQWMYQDPQERSQVAAANMRARGEMYIEGLANSRDFTRHVGARMSGGTPDVQEQVQAITVGGVGVVRGSSRLHTRLGTQLVPQVSGQGDAAGMIFSFRAPAASPILNNGSLYRAVDARNAYTVQEQPGKVQSTGYFDGKAIHHQFMSRNAQPAAQPRGQFGNVGNPARQGQSGGIDPQIRPQQAPPAPQPAPNPAPQN